MVGQVEANGAVDFGCDRPVVRLGEPDKVNVQLEVAALTSSRSLDGRGRLLESRM